MARVRARSLRPLAVVQSDGWQGVCIYIACFSVLREVLLPVPLNSHNHKAHARGRT